ncbi:DUF4825 domain-containing protein [Paraclostridium tenue]
MKIFKFKVILPLIMIVLSLGFVGCEKTKNAKEDSNESKISVDKLLEYKDSYVGNNSAIGNIISNLPANIYNKKFELQTKSKPYEINIDYKDFEDTYVKFEDNTSITIPFSEAIKKNAMILLSLVKNADIINFNFENGTDITYKRDELVDAYKNDYGVNLEKITNDKSSLENFIKNDIN